MFLLVESFFPSFLFLSLFSFFILSKINVKNLPNYFIIWWSFNTIFSQIVILIASLQQTFADLPLWISFS